jgi:hypothetical protein
MQSRRNETFGIAHRHFSRSCQKVNKPLLIFRAHRKHVDESQESCFFRDGCHCHGRRQTSVVHVGRNSRQLNHDRHLASMYLFAGPERAKPHQFGRWFWRIQTWHGEYLSRERLAEHRRTWQRGRRTGSPPQWPALRRIQTMPYCHSSAILGALVFRVAGTPTAKRVARKSFSHLPVTVSNHNPRWRGLVAVLFLRPCAIARHWAESVLGRKRTVVSPSRGVTPTGTSVSKDPWNELRGGEFTLVLPQRLEIRCGTLLREPSQLSPAQPPRYSERSCFWTLKATHDNWPDLSTSARPVTREAS